MDSSSSQRTLLKTIFSSGDGGLQFSGERFTVGGWVKSFHFDPKKEDIVPPADVALPDLTCAEVLFLRVPLFRCILKILSNHLEGTPPVQEKLEKKMEGIAFVRINDGSSVHNLQVVLDSNTHPLEQVLAIGTSVLLQGVIQQAQKQKESKYLVELKVDKVLHLGPVNPDKYPLSKLRLSLETIRAYPHFRARTTTVASVARIRSKLIYSMHNYFQENNFHHVTMPIITTTPVKSSNFYVTQLLNKSNYIKPQDNNTNNITLEGIKASIKEKTKQIEELKRSDSNKEALNIAETDLKNTNELALKIENEEKEKSNLLDKNKIVKVDFLKDYFGCEAYLSSNSGVHLESYACALGNVYNFGPVFNPVQNSFKLNLAEMWVLNTELAFSELEDAMKCAEVCLKYVSDYILTSCSEDINFLSSRFENKCMDRVRALLSCTFAKVSYTEALEALQKVNDAKSETKIQWGATFSEENKSYLVDEIYKEPIIIYDYPKETQPFYARIKDDAKTVSAFEIIFPKAGTVISGTQKEESIDMISSRIKECGLSEEKLDWYMDLRRHGTVNHSGFNLNFERLVMFLTGLGDVRDVIPFPRTKFDATC